MLLTNKHLGKLSEASIAEQYSMYLQRVLIMEVERGIGPSSALEQENLLSYDEFKDYFIMALVGKDNYVETLAQQIQHQNLIEKT